LGVGGFFWWQSHHGPTETTLTFVLTDLEVPHNGQLLRYEHIETLRCQVFSEEGVEVAQIMHRSPGAVAHSAPVNVPKGDYLLRIRLQFTNEKQIHLLRRVKLAGEKVTVSVSPDTPKR
jgi:hypothetical protein